MTISSKLTCILLLTCSLLFTACGSDKQSVAIEKPAISYETSKIDEPKSAPETWQSGSKRQITYNVIVPSNASDEQLQQIAKYIVKTDAEPRKNWNVAVVKLIKDNNSKGSAYMMALFTKNAKVSDGNTVRPGDYADFSWKFDTY